MYIKSAKVLKNIVEILTPEHPSAPNLAIANLIGASLPPDGVVQSLLLA